MYYSKKLIETQQTYLKTDQEFLAIVEYLKQYKTLLLGQRIVVWIDNKNLTYENTKSTNNRVINQRLLLEGYGVELKFIKEKRSRQQKY